MWTKIPNRVPLFIFILVLLYTASLFIAPLTMESGTVDGLNGHANRLSYRELWTELSPYHAIVYAFSDFNCHQMHERSYSINGNQMPVCARCVGIFVGLTLGALIMVFLIPKDDFKDTLLSLVPMNTDGMSSIKKTILLVSIGLSLIIPMGVDGFAQLLTEHESTNVIRMMTGFPAGIAFSMLICALLMTAARTDLNDHDRQNPYI